MENSKMPSTTARKGKAGVPASTEVARHRLRAVLGLKDPATTDARLWSDAADMIELLRDKLEERASRNPGRR